MQPFNPFAPPVEADVKKFVGEIVMRLAQKYHVEVRWNVPGSVILPNGEFMAGVPGTDNREYRILTGQFWATAETIAADTDKVLQANQQRRDSWSGRMRRWFSAPNQALTVPGPIGAFEVKEFSAVKQLP